MRAVRSPLARSDAIGIWRYVATDSEAFADALLERIDAKLRLLAANPRLGRERPELGNGLRSFTVGNYVLYYRPIDGGMELVRLLHGARDVADIPIA
ncbi:MULTISPECIES: type II toxin-antitoxin system RelE/ParE family toxin [unclassified Sphingomonas]|uniref:type II toxin-antitoxin system RelE/ParE family toxin n=1 Tax=unclassified Sphingomonas TaxID=196159 RepID=UPI001F568D05